jgi:hypothetical protein
MRRIHAVIQVAPWDWGMLRWSLPGWARVADEITLVYESTGRCWSCPERHQLAHVPITQVARLAGTLDVPVQWLMYQLPELDAEDYADHFRRVENRVRNMASWSVRQGSVMLTPDADEYPVDPEALRRGILDSPAVGNRVAFRAGCTDVVAVRGTQAVVVESDRPYRPLIAMTTPGAWGSSRSTHLPALDLPTSIVHWRARARGDAFDAHHDHYLGAGFCAWLDAVQAGDDPPIVEGQFRANVRSWRGTRLVPLADLGCPLPLPEST